MSYTKLTSCDCPARLWLFIAICYLDCFSLMYVCFILYTNEMRSDFWTGVHMIVLPLRYENPAGVHILELFINNFTEVGMNRTIQKHNEISDPAKGEMTRDRREDLG